MNTILLKLKKPIYIVEKLKTNKVLNDIPDIFLCAEHQIDDINQFDIVDLEKETWKHYCNSLRILADAIERHIDSIEEI